MFNGTIDPEMMRLAQEQMSKIPPDQLLKMQQQIMGNPDLMRMASESMKNMNPADLKFAAEQMKNVRTEDMAELSKKISESSPEELAAMKARADLQVSYLIQAAQSLKNQGNQFHAVGKYTEAAEKYSLAKTNANGIPSPEAKSLVLACSLNLMSCYLKTGQFEECIRLGSEVLGYDAINIKALYRRGQAYRQIGKLEMAIEDLRKAADASPYDEMIEQILREAKRELEEKRSHEIYQGPVIEEITEEEAAEFSEKIETSIPESDSENLVTTNNDDILESNKLNDSHASSSQGTDIPNEKIYAESLKNIADNPDMIRTMQNIMANVSPESLAALSGDKLSPDMVKSASEMFKGISPEVLQNMIKMSSSFRDQHGASSSQSDEIRGPSLSSALNQSKVTDLSTNFSSDPACSKAPDFSMEMQDQIRNQMKDPAMRQMLATMVKSMPPEMMSSMSEKFGVKLSHEEAVKAHSVMSSLSPDDLDKLMNWADKLQRWFHKAKMFKNWMLGTPGLIFAILMLLLAILLHWLGYIGK
eukprot:TRINITY_DN1603_c0_g1_i1.p1 TRINITY_DN1603_c0_g1~~TRINITY_DN1603_c0_g1_i1.p1  ORF type:complete len:531 (-),score=140.97 TRINITY_DN1603_c0_g1_i1:407-1999(-)